jgi:hypothetical protein
MSQPFSGMPKPEIPRPEAPRPFKRRSQPAVIQETIEKALRTARDRVRPMLDRAGREGRAGLWLAQRHAQNLWHKGKRNPRALGLITGAVVLILGGGAYALSASGAGRSMCPPAGRTAPFILLMDPVPSAAARSELDIYYDVCGLRSGAPYHGKVRLSQPQVAGKKKKKSAKPKLVVTFQGKADGPATRRHQPLDLGSMKPGPYTLELIVFDGRGRERRSQQKVLLKQ